MNDAPPPSPGAQAAPLLSETLSPAEERFEFLRRRAGFYLAPLAFFLTLWLTSGRLTPEGSRLSATLACTLVLWLTEAIPLPMTALLGATLCILLGVAEAEKVLAPFANPIIFLFIGSFLLAHAMMLHRLDRRFALAMLSVRWVGAKPGRMLFMLGGVTALLSMWVSNTATTAMMLPIALGLLGAMSRTGSGAQPVRRSAFAAGMMLMIPYSASVGGLGTPIGSPPNLIGIGFIEKQANVHISFLEWMALGAPMIAAMYGVLYLLLRRLHPPGSEEMAHESDLAAYLRREREALGGWTRGQINTLIAFGTAILLWVLPGVLAIYPGREHPLTQWTDSRLPESAVAMLAATLLFVLPTDAKRGEFTLHWQEATRISWGTILLFGGGLSLGGLMFSTGVAQSLGQSVTALTGANSLWTLTALAIAMAIVMSEATSNAAAANMITPVVIALAAASGVNPIPPALGACIGASFGFMLPVSTAPNAIAYGSGLIPITKMIRAGILFDILGFFIILLALRLLCPLLGWS
jgi:sodium-dependent dicarboxylate transporter 2/3/5